LGIDGNARPRHVQAPPGGEIAFLADSGPDAYGRAVERLLASPRSGERLALEWLDAARFADTNGYHIDNGRDMTHWRDWVIDSFNRNIPFDRFMIEQIAGDLLPEATREQRIASGFNRNHMINFEGGGRGVAGLLSGVRCVVGRHRPGARRVERICLSAA
jgi:hypothetical protein